MITRLSLFLALIVLFAMPCKGQEDIPKDNSFHSPGKNDQPEEKRTHGSSHNYGSLGSYENDDLLFTVSTDLAQDALFRPNIGADFRVSECLSLGLNVGYELPSPIFAVNPLANGQFTYPGTVYNGIALRLGLKYYFDEGHPANYLCLQAVYKSISFNNVQFKDFYGDAENPAWNYYTMSEKTNMIGGDIFIGHNTGSEDSKVCINLFLGVGVHALLRNYTISNESLDLSNYAGSFNGLVVAYNGNYNKVTPILAIITGVKLVFKYAKKVN